MMIPTILLSSEEFQVLRTLARQLVLCEKRAVHVRCVLLLNNIVDIPRDLAKLLHKCFELNEKDPLSEHAFVTCLSHITDVSLGSSKALLKFSDQVEELRLWVTVLKALYDFFKLHRYLWTNCATPREARQQFQEELKEYDCDGSIRMELMKVPELAEFLKEETAEERFMFLLEETIDLFRMSQNSQQLEKKVQEIQMTIPAGFTIPVGIFYKLLELESFMLSCDRVDQALKLFYTLLFFAYENSSDRTQICQLYTDNKHYSETQKLLRNEATLHLFFEAADVLLEAAAEQKMLDVMHLVDWLLVINPQSLLLRNVDFSEDL